jgi:hypothetical protein
MWYSVLTVSGRGEIWLQGSGQAEKVLPQPEVGYGEHEMKARHPKSSYYQRSIVVQNRKRNLLLKKLTKRTATLRHVKRGQESVYWVEGVAPA